MREFDPVMLLLICITVPAALTDAGLGLAPGLFAALSRSADIDATLTAMWSMGEAVLLEKSAATFTCARLRGRNNLFAGDSLGEVI